VLPQGKILESALVMRLLARGGGRGGAGGGGKLDPEEDPADG